MIWVGKDVRLVQEFGCRYRITRWGFRVFGVPFWLVRREQRLSGACARPTRPKPGN